MVNFELVTVIKLEFLHLYRRQSSTKRHVECTISQSGLNFVGTAVMLNNEELDMWSPSPVGVVTCEDYL